MNKWIFALATSLLFGIPVFSGAASKADRDENMVGSSAQRVYDSRGNHRVFWEVIATTHTPVAPLDAQGLLWDQDTLRQVVVQNGTSDYLHIVASVTANGASPHFKIERSSVNAPANSAVSSVHNWSTLNHATFWMLLEPTGVGNKRVRGYAEID